jgi:hypothetical protein
MKRIVRGEGVLVMPYSRLSMAGTAITYTVILLSRDVARATSRAATLFEASAYRSCVIEHKQIIHYLCGRRFIALSPGAPCDKFRAVFYFV